MIIYTKADVIARAAKLEKYGHKQAAQMLRDFAPMIDQPQSAGSVSQPELGDGVSVNIFGLIAAIKQIPVRREAMSGQMLTYVQRDEVIGAIEDFAAHHARGVPDGFDFAAHLQRQREWSGKTFGPGSRAQGVVDHIRKELCEIEADPGDLKEWIDVVILALDGAWRSGAQPGAIVDALVAKQTKNEGRIWPDWRTADPNKAIEHDRSHDADQPTKDVQS